MPSWPDQLARYRAAPQESYKHLVDEYTSLALNHRTGLFGPNKSLRDRLRTDGAVEVHTLADAALERCRWAVYRVRRCYTAPGKAWRCIQIVHRADRAEASALLTGLATHLRIRLRTDGEHTRLWLAPPSTEFPRLEEFFVAAPDSVIEKRRLNFETRWHGHADTALLTLEHRAELFCDSRTARAA